VHRLCLPGDCRTTGVRLILLLGIGSLPHERRFRDVVQVPLSDFMTAIAPRVAKISKHIVVDPRPNGGSMFRIYRDVRFSKDKRPYKENAGLQFRHALGRDAHAPGFYMHFEPDEIFFGGGVWMAEPEALHKVRRAIADKPKAWKAVVEDKTFKSRFDGVRGEALVRPPKGFDPEHPYIDDIKRKSFFAMHETAPKIALTANLVDEVDATFKATKPLMKFLCEALDVPF
jgi:uncharacterized protein (TIGR02453 family)